MKILELGHLELTPKPQTITVGELRKILENVNLTDDLEVWFNIPYKFDFKYESLKPFDRPDGFGLTVSISPNSSISNTHLSFEPTGPFNW